MKKQKEKLSRESIVKSSFILFLEKGYKEVTIKNIMEATNLSKGAIYHYFNSKEEIYFAALETYYFDLLTMDESGFTTGNFKDDVRMLYQIASDMFSSIENLDEDGVYYPIRNYYSFQLESEKNELIQNKTQQALGEFRTMIENVVLRGLKKKQIKSNLNVSAITFHLIALIEGVAIHHSTFKDEVREKLMDKYELVFDSYLKLICTN